LKFFLAFVTLTLVAMPVVSAADTHPVDSDSALQTLSSGNHRYVTNHASHPHQNQSLRRHLVDGQQPVAAILSCADSRVPPELVFDQGLGDLFTVRVAGNVVDDAITGSLEYAAEHLHVPVIIVLGHSNCGAVKATIDGGEPYTHIESLVQAIRPAVEQASHEKGLLIDNAVRDNVRFAVKQLRESGPILSKLIGEGKLHVVGAVYHMDTGAVEYLK
jgi:carbonic anhydrase